MREFRNVDEWHCGVSQSQMVANTRLVLFAISLFANRVGQGIAVSVGVLAERTGLSKPSVIKHLKLAEEAGWIGAQRYDGTGARLKRNEYSLKFPEMDLEG
ncbi:MarR family protein [Pseudovibrio axinellae]|uniref:MarR family protein n=1 Tax=Pseudovibrio axinellae TaxID=989403 RepID=A0A165SW59_9HYPH|nr:helix-turn-helix domain-containing protein [Pseudovibrio axinellae]KZL04556.1 MarR family protein [Pseudovibrio axinellae]SEQ73198.1 Helix-turn-helix domain-containing protein [Pseudovibrio axinellae]